MSGPEITIEAGTGGEVGELTQAAVIRGGVGNQPSGDHNRSDETANLKDLGIEKISVKGPAKDLKVQKVIQAGVIEGGVSNMHTEPKREESANKNEEDAMQSENGALKAVTQADGRQRVYRRRGERLAAAAVKNIHPFGGGGVMVWEGVIGQVFTIQSNLAAQRYRDDILRTEVLLFLQQPRQGVILQHDNARRHTALITKDFLNANNVQVLPLPSRSSDLNPTEHL